VIYSFNALSAGPVWGAGRCTGTANSFNDRATGRRVMSYPVAATSPPLQRLALAAWLCPRGERFPRPHVVSAALSRC